MKKKTNNLKFFAIREFFEIVKGDNPVPPELLPLYEIFPKNIFSIIHHDRNTMKAMNDKKINYHITNQLQLHHGMEPKQPRNAVMVFTMNTANGVHVYFVLKWKGIGHCFLPNRTYKFFSVVCLWNIEEGTEIILSVSDSGDWMKTEFEYFVLMV